MYRSCNTSSIKKYTYQVVNVALRSDSSLSRCASRRTRYIPLPSLMHVNLQLTTNARSDASNGLVEMQLTMRPPKGPDLRRTWRFVLFRGIRGGKSKDFVGERCGFTFKVRISGIHTPLERPQAVSIVATVFLLPFPQPKLIKNSGYDTRH